MDVFDFILFMIIVKILVEFGFWYTRVIEIDTALKRAELIKEISDRIHQVEIEHHGDLEYWFDKDSGTFLGQGANKDEILETVRKRFPNDAFLIEGLGGASASTNWKIVEFSELKVNIKA